MDTEEAQHLRALIEALRKRLRVLELQAVQYGLECPPHIRTEIEDIKKRIVLFEQQAGGGLGELQQGLSNIAQELGKVTVKEEREFRLFGLRIWSSVVSRTFIFVFIAALMIGSYALQILVSSRSAVVPTSVIVTPMPIPTRTLASISSTIVVPTPVIVTSAPVIVTSVPVPTRTATPIRPMGFTDSWSGATDQGETITFQVEPSPLGEAVVNLSVTFQFAPPCPIGNVTFQSIGDAHIFDGPGNSFLMLMQEPDASATLRGAFTSPATASGTLEVYDTRDPLERNVEPCPFRTLIEWAATKP